MYSPCVPKGNPLSQRNYRIASAHIFENEPNYNSNEDLADATLSEGTKSRNRLKNRVAKLSKSRSRSRSNKAKLSGRSRSKKSSDGKTVFSKSTFGPVNMPR